MSKEKEVEEEKTLGLSTNNSDDGVVIEDAEDKEIIAEAEKLRMELNAINSNKKELGQDNSIKKGFFDVRVAVVGNVDSGKSTLIGVLTGGELDNGRGFARSKVFVHRHEAENGRTSCISQHIMGFNGKNEVVHQNVAASASAASKTKAWNTIVEGSRSVVTFIDLAGHEKYLKTTIAGLTGCFPDYAIVIINSLAGISKMTKEHLGVVIALEIPLVCVVSKVDMCPENVLKRTKKQLFKILKSPAAGKLPINIRTSKDIDIVIGNESPRLCPVFFLSSVTGKNLNLLTEYLSQIRPRKDWTEVMRLPTEFAIDETFSVTGVGIVVSGTVSRGVLKANSELLLGPDTDGTFTPVLVRTIHAKRLAVESCSAGDSCAISLRSLNKKKTLKRQHIRRGMVLVDPTANPQATRTFEAEVLVLHHPTTIKMCYQAVIHCGNLRQTASIDQINKECLRTGDKAVIRWTFMIRPEYIHPGQTFIFREGSTKGIGRVLRPIVGEEAKQLADAINTVPKKQQRKMERQNQLEAAAADGDEKKVKADTASTKEDKPAPSAVELEKEDGDNSGKPTHRSWANIRTEKKKLKDEKSKTKDDKEEPTKPSAKSGAKEKPAREVAKDPKDPKETKEKSAVKEPAKEKPKEKPTAKATKEKPKEEGDKEKKKKR